MKKNQIVHIHKKYIKIISILCGIIVVISIGKVLNDYRNDWELIEKKILWKVQNHPDRFSFHEINGIIPNEYFIEKQNDSCLIIIKLRKRTALEYFEITNSRFVKCGVEIRISIRYIGADAKANYYKTLDELVRIGALGKLNKDTLTIEDIKFEGNNNEYYNFENGISIYYWGITKTELNLLFVGVL
jgi:hypothetical protein